MLFYISTALKSLANAMAAWYGKEDFDLAKMYFQKTKKMLLKKKVYKKIPQIDNAIGTIEILKGNYEGAHIILQEAYKEAEKK